MTINQAPYDIPALDEITEDQIRELQLPKKLEERLIKAKQEPADYAGAHIGHVDKGQDPHTDIYSDRG